MRVARHPMHLAQLTLTIAVLLFAALACSSSSKTPSTSTPKTLVALAGCPITTITTPYVGRAPYLAQPPEYYKSVWHGNDALWTIIHPGGEVWSTLPKSGGEFTQKTWWWSRSFDINTEREPAIIVSGTRLDAAGSFTSGNPGTHGWADFGTAMLVGISIPSEGCWEIRAQYKGAELAYVVLVVK